MAKSKEPDVQTYLKTLDHPRKVEIVALREVILASDKSIQESIKWNAPSFYTTEHFATMNLRGKSGIAVIMHFGAKKREAKGRPSVADSAALLEWLADDRAIVTFSSVAEIEEKRVAYQALLREWMKLV